MHARIRLALAVFAFGLAGLAMWAYGRSTPEGGSVPESGADQAIVLSVSKASSSPIAVPDTSHAFLDAAMGIAFEYPAGFSVATATDETTGITMLFVRDVSGVRVQIVVTPFDERMVTKERILRDVPDLSIRNERPIEIAGAEAGLAFESGEGESKTREIWFAFGGKLYQVTALLADDALVQGILSTWRFGGR